MVRGATIPTHVPLKWRPRKQSFSGCFSALDWNMPAHRIIWELASLLLNFGNALWIRQFPTSFQRINSIVSQNKRNDKHVLFRHCCQFLPKLTKPSNISPFSCLTIRIFTEVSASVAIMLRRGGLLESGPKKICKVVERSCLFHLKSSDRKVFLKCLILGIGGIGFWYRIRFINNPRTIYKLGDCLTIKSFKFALWGLLKNTHLHFFKIPAIFLSYLTLIEPRIERSQFAEWLCRHSEGSRSEREAICIWSKLPTISANISLRISLNMSLQFSKLPSIYLYGAETTLDLSSEDIRTLTRSLSNLYNLNNNPESLSSLALFLNSCEQHKFFFIQASLLSSFFPIFRGAINISQKRLGQNWYFCPTRYRKMKHYLASLDWVLLTAEIVICNRKHLRWVVKWRSLVNSIDLHH